jgi:hypothetical protein
MWLPCSFLKASVECSKQRGCYEDRMTSCWADSPLLRAAGHQGSLKVSVREQITLAPSILAYLQEK